MKIKLLMDIIYNATFASLIATELIQFIKEKLNIKNIYLYLIIEFIIGFLYTLTFTDLGVIPSLWGGLIVIIGADGLYQTLKGKLGLKSKEKSS